MYGEANGNKSEDGCCDQIQNPDVFVVGGHEPAGKEPLGVVVMSVGGCIYHAILLRPQSFTRALVVLTEANLVLSSRLPQTPQWL